ncbi:hypothetical protein E3N88_36106 [Mikania micrantha]|uniref:Uncharacterized protein n=1 Tax=Mikania micrantha TaxID=192012 RepID=A0A5N6M3V2_9ASTR|nr:hypothetical protein E3N88_36106 [Mikania micrantha]
MDTNNPFFIPFINCYRPQVNPNNPKNPKQFLTFSNWYPQPPFFNENSHAFDNFSENQPEPDVDVVSETQPEAQQTTLRRRHRRKEVPEKTTKPTITRWSEVEEVTLARAYIDVSKDLFVSNNQTSMGFWKRVRAQFFSEMGRDSYRRNDMISGKLRDLQRKVAKFNGVWIQHHNNGKSDEDDETVMNEALMTYVRENGSFSHIAAWQVVITCSDKDVM